MAVIKDPPIGTIVPFAGPVDLAWEKNYGYALCDGRSVPRTGTAPNGEKYGALFDAIGSSWGGDGVNNFNLPDLRGLFLRGVDGTAGLDPDKDNRIAMKAGGHDKNQVGSFQMDALQTHRHNDHGHVHGYKDVQNAGGVQFAEAGGQVWAMKAPTVDQPRTTEGGNAVIGDPVSSPSTRPVHVASETRPVNAYVIWVIRYKA